MKLIKAHIALFSLLILTSCGGITDRLSNSAPEEFIADIYDSSEELIIASTPTKTTEFVDNRLNIIRKYEASWMGVKVADLIYKIKSEEIADQRSSRLQVIIRTYGLARMVNGFQSDTQALIAYSEKGEYHPINYQTSFKMRKKRRDIMLIYNESGDRIISETNIPPEKRWKRPAVAESSKIGAYDPLTLALIAREKLISAIKSGAKNFSLPLYDGRRRSEIAFTIHENTKDETIHLSFVEKPLFGFTNNELKALKKRDPVVHIYVSRKDFLPLRAQGDSRIGKANVKLIKECTTLTQCL